MTQEDKELLLTDLSARLPYGVKVRHITENAKKIGASYLIDVLNPILYKYILEDNILALPYLRPMSSMTYNEKLDYILRTHKNWDKYDNEVRELTIDAVDWLNAHHFDYRGLINKGLALEAPKEMYNI